MINETDRLFINSTKAVNSTPKQERLLGVIPIKDNDSCTITNQEIMDMPLISGQTFDQAMLFKLKAKGAPVLGVVLLRLDPGYSFMSYQDNSSLTRHYKWKRTNAN